MRLMETAHTPPTLHELPTRGADGAVIGAFVSSLRTLERMRPTGAQIRLASPPQHGHARVGAGGEGIQDSMRLSHDAQE